MKQVRPREPAHRPLAIQMGHRLREGLLIVVVALAIFLLIALVHGILRILAGWVQGRGITGS